MPQCPKQPPRRAEGAIGSEKAGIDSREGRLYTSWRILGHIGLQYNR